MYINDKGEHVDELKNQSKADFLKGLESPSRRKDMIGIVTMLLFLLNKCSIPFQQHNRKTLDENFECMLESSDIERSFLIKFIKQMKSIEPGESPETRA